MIYVYALTELPPPVVSDISGLEDRPIATLVSEGVAAAYSELSTGRTIPSAENLWRHEAVVESIMQRSSAVLPVRFGMMLPADAARSALSHHGPVLTAALTRVHDSAELGLRVLTAHKVSQTPPKTPETDVSGSGSDYMQALLASEHRRRDARARAERLGETIHSALAPLARENTHLIHDSVDSPSSLLMTAAYLVHRTRITQFITRVQVLETEHSDLSLICTGPWPAYHFVPSLEFEELRHG